VRWTVAASLSKYRSTMERFDRPVPAAVRRPALALCLAAGLACAVYLVAVFEADFMNLWQYDFRIFREGGRQLVAGQSPYAEQFGFFSPLPLAVLFAPLSLLSVPVAAAVFHLATLALLWRAAGRRAVWALLSFPVLFNLFVGQVDLFLALCAAVLGPLALPLLLGKPQVAFVAVPWLLVQGVRGGRAERWRLAAGIAAAAAMLGLCFWLQPLWLTEMRRVAPPIAVYATHASNLHRLVLATLRVELLLGLAGFGLGLAAWLRQRRDSWTVLHLFNPLTNVYSAAVLAEWIGPVEMLLSWAAFLLVGCDVHHGAPLYVMALAILVRQSWPAARSAAAGWPVGEPVIPSTQ
jgi:hypothetical protein